MRNKKVRIVCEVVNVPYTSPNSGAEYRLDVWQEVYSSMYRVDCENWMARKQEENRKQGVNKVYHIFVSDMPS